MNTKQKVSKTMYNTCINMFYNNYKVTIKMDFEDGDGYYRRLTVNMYGNDEKEAKKAVKEIMEANTEFAPESFNDYNGWCNWCDGINAAVKAKFAEIGY